MEHHTTNPHDATTEDLAGGGPGLQGIDLLDLVISVGKRMRVILGVTLGVAVVAAAISLLLPNEYTATAQVVPRQPKQGALAAMLGSMGGLAQVAGAQDLMQNNNDLYIGVLESRTVADALIERFHLSTVFGGKRQSDVRRRLADATVISSNTGGILNIEVTTRDPQLSAALANGYVDEVISASRKLGASEASQRRQFFEDELKATKQRMTDAEEAMKRTEETTGVMQVDGQARALLEAAGRLRGEITAREVSLRAMRQFATDQNPDVIRVQQEIAGLKVELNRLEHGSDATGGIVSRGKLPQSALEYFRKLRELKYQESVFELLSKQYEAARLEEANTASAIQVLDAAIAPDQKSKPKRALIVLVSMMLAMMVTSAWAIGAATLARMKSDPVKAERLSALRNAFSFRKALTFSKMEMRVPKR